MTVIELKRRAPSRLFLFLQLLPVLLFPLLVTLTADAKTGAEYQPHVVALVFAGLSLVFFLSAIVQFRTRYRLEKDALVCDFWLLKLRVPRQRIVAVSLVKWPFLGEVLRVRYRLLAIPKWQTLQLERPQTALMHVRNWLADGRSGETMDAAETSRDARR